MNHATAFVSGAIFAIGLILSQMTHPFRVIGFLDLQNWDPTLMFVMGGAVIVYGIAFHFITKQPKPFAGPKFVVPTSRRMDPKLIIGAILFGVGWGIGGFCPGPGLVSVSSGMSAAVFVVAMLVGMFGHGIYQNYSESEAKTQP